MATIEDFTRSLSSTARDDFAIVLQAMTNGSAAKRIVGIANELTRVISRINTVNAQREQLSGEKTVLQRLVKKLDEFLERGGSDLEARLLRQHLSNQLDKLKVRIAETRPDDDLKLKHDLVQERNMLKEGQRIGIELLGRIAHTGSK